MDGMPRFAPIVPDLKKPGNEYDEEFVYSLKEYILMHFQADPSNFDAAIADLLNMKQEVLKCHADVEAVCILKRYFSQLLMMKNRFPMEQNGEVRAIFSWYERALEMPTAQTFADINFEMACVMYQIGSIHAIIAGQENRQSDESIKNAFMHFQYAAWPFQYIRDTMEVSLFGTSDFDKDLLTFHVNVLLAQAQECLLEKSLLDSRRSALTVVKLAAYLRDIYSQCNTLLRNSNSAVEMLSAKKYKLWTQTMAVKSEIYGCIAMLYMAYKEEADQKFGNRLAWCQAADHYLGRAVKVAGGAAKSEFYDTLSFVQDVVKGKLENAKKENDFIYHERVPKFEDLIGTVAGDCKVSPRSFDPLDPSIGGEDIFGALVPPTVLSAVSEYEEEKAKLKRDLLKRVAEKDDELQEYLGRLNASELGLTSGPSFVIPDILLERNAAMHSQGDAVPQVLQKLQKVDQLARDADSQLNALSSRLRAITTPEFVSDEGYKAISAEISRLMDHHIQARGLNAELHKALAAHSTNIHLLCLPLRELTEKIAPHSDISPANTKEGQALIRVLDKASEMQSQRALLLDTFSKELMEDNISKKLLAERDTDSQETFAEELKKHDKIIQFVNANLTAQENILHHLTEANADFAEQRNVIQDLNKDRFEQVMTLVTAFDIYMDVSSKTEDGQRFYENLHKRIAKLGTAVEAIESAYQQEMAKLESQKRAVEEKKAAVEAARKAREDLADFGGGAGGMGSQTPASQPSGRPRLGDYMQYYRNKMAAKGGLPPPQQPIQMAGPEMYPGPPSPAPSSIAGDFHQDHHYVPFVSPIPSSYSMPPVEQRQPAVLPGQQYHQYQPQQQQFMPPQSRQRQPYVPSHVPQQQYGAFPPNPALSSVHSSTSELNRINQSATPTLSIPPTPQRITPDPMGQQSMYYQQPVIQNGPGQQWTNQQPMTQQYSQPSGYVQGAGHQPNGYPPTVVQQGYGHVASPVVPQVSPQRSALQAVDQTPLSAFVPVNPSQGYQTISPQRPVGGQGNPGQAYQNYQQPGVQQPSQTMENIQPVTPQPTQTMQAISQQSNLPIQQPVQQFSNPGAQTPQSFQQPVIPQSSQPVQNFQMIHQPPQTIQAVQPQQFSQQNSQTSFGASSGPTLAGGPGAQGYQTLQNLQQPVTPQPGQTVQNIQPVPQQPQQQQLQQPAPSQPQQYGLQMAFGPGSGQNTVVSQGSQPQMGYQLSCQPMQNIQSVPQQVNQQFQLPAPAPSIQPQQSGQMSVGPKPEQPTGQQTLSQAAQAPNPSNQSIPAWGTPHMTAGQSNSSSPWHNTAPSPWHRLSQAPFTPSPAQPVSTHPNLETPVLGGGTPQSSSNQTPQPGANVDLLSSLVSEMSLPPPIAPSQTARTATEFHNLQQTVPRAVDPNFVRPAAAVIPFQHKSATATSSNSSMLSMVNPSTVSIAPQGQVQSSLYDLINPDKFNIGESDKIRLEKRQLHAAIRGAGPMPSMDPLDPLNQLDPFWGVKKA